MYCIVLYLSTYQSTYLPIYLPTYVPAHRLTRGQDAEEKVVVLPVAHAGQLRSVRPAGLLRLCPRLGRGVGGVALVPVAIVTRGTGPVLVG